MLYPIELCVPLIDFHILSTRLAEIWFENEIDVWDAKKCKNALVKMAMEQFVALILEHNWYFRNTFFCSTCRSNLIRLLFVSIHRYTLRCRCDTQLTLVSMGNWGKIFSLDLDSSQIFTRFYCLWDNMEALDFVSNFSDSLNFQLSVWFVSAVSR